MWPKEQSKLNPRSPSELGLHQLCFYSNCQGLARPLENCTRTAKLKKLNYYNYGPSRSNVGLCLFLDSYLPLTLRFCLYLFERKTLHFSIAETLAQRLSGSRNQTLSKFQIKESKWWVPPLCRRLLCSPLPREQTAQTTKLNWKFGIESEQEQKQKFTDGCFYLFLLLSHNKFDFSFLIVDIK